MTWGNLIPRQKIQRAIDAREFKVFYQVKVDGDRGAIEYEALCRWGLYSPAEFFTSALVQKLIPALSLVIASSVAEDLDRYRTPIVSVNLSPLELADLAHLLMLIEILEPYRERVKFEVTEDALLEDKAVASLKLLHKHGFLLGLDDFGVGYPRMALLPKLPIDYVKFDRSLCQRCDDPDHAALLGHWCEYFRDKFRHPITGSIGIPCTAEGVETEEQFDRLKELGFDRFQGFYFGRPSPPSLLFSEEQKTDSMGG